MKTKSLVLAMATMLALGVIALGSLAAADVILAPASDFTSIRGYTYVKVVNTSSSTNTITITFKQDDGTTVASTSSAVAPGSAWTIGTSSSFTQDVQTGEFDGFACVSDTGSDEFVAYGAVAFPVDGNAGIGNSLAVSGFPGGQGSVTGC